MRRALLVMMSLAWVACGGVKLEEYRRPFACDHKGGDGGQQCSDGWACGFDDRCFDKALDGGQSVVDWRCEKDDHCPPDWRCGELVDSQRYCQQRDVGAPSRCATDDGGCQGGWRCSAASRCFDPKLTDGGTERDCTRDGQCPDDYRCGEGATDASVSHCIQRGVGAPSTCHSDDGCEGTYRCDTFATRCVDVTDVVTSGRLQSPGFTLVSPLSTRGTPLKFAITRISSVPSAYGGSAAGLDPLFGPPLQSGVLMAWLYPDGVVVASQLTNGDMIQSDGGTSRSLFDKWFPLRGSPADVTDLVATTEGPVVRYRDGGVEWVFDGGSGPLVPADFLRQVDPFDDNGPTRVVTVSGGIATLGGGPPAPFGSIQELVAFQTRAGLATFAFTDAGLRAPDGGVGPALPAAPSLGVVAGFTPESTPRRLSAFVLVPRAIGGPELVAYTPANNGTDWDRHAGLSACPDGGAALTVSFDEDPNHHAALVARCVSEDGGAFPVLVRLNGMQVGYFGIPEDQVPFREPSVFQRASPFIRAHAAASGRAWHTVDADGYGLVGHQPLRPIVLDRQPDTIVSFVSPLVPETLFAQSQGYLFKADPDTGMVSALAGQTVTPLLVIPTNPDWILTDQGVIDLLHSASGPPRMMALMPAGHTLSAPVTGISAQLRQGTSVRDVILASSSDTIWVADVTEAKVGAFAQPATFEAVLVPVPGVRLRSMTLESTTDGGVSGYLTTSTENLRFSTGDLVRWSLNPVAAPQQPALPLEVWTEDGRGRTGFSDGRVWSLPIMVPLTEPLSSRSGGALSASDFGRKCGDLFAATAEGLFRAEPAADGGLPGWNPLDAGSQLDTSEALRFYETRGHLFVATQTGRVVEVVSATSCP